MSTALYMVAIMPPPPIAKDIEQIRFGFADKYNCKAALKPPVHITLIPPYKTQSESEEKIIPAMEHWAASHEPFSLVLLNYATFANNGVVFINVLPNEDGRMFQRGLRSEFLQVLPMPEVKRYTSFHPHITIGYRDIPKDLFKEAANDYQQRALFSTFVVDRFHLWRHDGTRWQVLRSFPLGKAA